MGAAPYAVEQQVAGGYWHIEQMRHLAFVAPFLRPGRDLSVGGEREGHRLIGKTGSSQGEPPDHGYPTRSLSGLSNRNESRFQPLPGHWGHTEHDLEECVVPRYFFTIEDNERLDPDDKGLVLPNADAAKAEAQTVLADMIRDELPNGMRLILKVKVEDEARHEIYRASLTFVDETSA